METEIETVLGGIEAATPKASVWRGDIPMGKHIRQGDVMLTRVDDKTPHGAVLAEGESVQIAVGQNVGARHIMTGGNGVTVFAPAKPGPLSGPIVVVGRGKKGLLTHPEHRHFELKCGTYAVTFQRDYMQEEIARVQD